MHRMTIFAVGITLLVGCGSGVDPREGAPTEPPPSDVKAPAIPVETPPLPDDEALALKARDLLVSRCGDCHGGAKKVKGFDVADRGTLLAPRPGGKPAVASPGQPDDSLLWQRVEDGSMPEGGDELADADKATIAAWIRAGLPVPVAEDRSPRSEAQTLGAISTYLKGLDPEIRPYQRFFTLTNLHNDPAVTDLDLRYARAALSKLLNSLSWRRDVVVPEPVDDTKAVYVIDVRRLDWDESEGWERLIRAYPYGLDLAKHKDPTVQQAARQIAEATGSRLAVLRADWFVATASRPPLYEQVLGLPKNVIDLERRLDVNVQSDYIRDKLRRAGFNTSGVSDQNRLVDRHDALFGAYWKSYDFERKGERVELERFPFGPRFAGNPFEDFAFEHAGGEMLFHLPNGLMGYYLSDAAGAYLPVAPTGIVQNRSPGTISAEILNGRSCMECHKTGIYPFERDSVGVATARNSRLAAKARRLFLLDPKVIAEVLERDERQFLIALELACGRFLRVGGDKDKPLKQFDEPIFRVAKRFEGNLSPLAVTLELGLARDDQGEIIAAVKYNRTLAEGLGLAPLQEGDTIPRATWEKAIKGYDACRNPFQVFAREMRLGGPLDNSAYGGDIVVDRTPAPPVPGPVPPHAGGIPEIGLAMVRIPKGSFTQGSTKYESDTPHPVTITKDFELASTEFTVGQHKKLNGEALTPETPEDQLPLVNVSWFDCVAICNKLSERANLKPYYKIDDETVTPQNNNGYRLPTEAEWEYACRAGSSGEYSFGDDVAKLGEHAWFEGNSDRKAHPVGQKTKNRFELFDMHGNVWEWCGDWYDANYYKELAQAAGSVNDPPGPNSGTSRVLRGGSFFVSPGILRGAYRSGLSPGLRYPYNGFRPARTYP